jgi:hypothetical protein
VRRTHFGLHLRGFYCVYLCVVLADVEIVWRDPMW